ncbi:protein kinase [Streptomyces sp. NPDC002564]|uniref:serine/threonine-protein kinase n=1 Tax=Streptomyces sp. NPDC002564 TaxID=3364649 RepID=UPI0036C54BA7
MAPDVGPIDDRYELRNLIGQGTMGQVYQAWDLQLKRAVAIKVINPERLTGSANGLKPDDIAARFCREAELGARFSHPNIPVLLDAQLRGSPKDLYMVWELVLGQDLGRVLHEDGRLPVARAHSVALQIAEVFDCLHADPVIHRDLKPANIMLTDALKVKVLDLGVAAVFGAANPRLTQAGQLMGTVAYMAPEQFGGIIVPQTDLYALGCVLYEMLTGEPPFTGDYAIVMDGHRYRRPVPIRDLRPDIPLEVAELVMNLLAKDVSDRPATARVVLDQLASYCPSPAAATQPEPQRQLLGGATSQGPSNQGVSAKTRMGQALALFDSGFFGQALPLYKELTSELAAAGPEHAHDAVECRAQAAYCDMRLGNQEQAIAAYRDLALELDQYDFSEVLRLQVHAYLGLLQESLGQAEDALNTLANLYPLLSARLGKDASQTCDVRAALNRLRSVSHS